MKSYNKAPTKVTLANMKLICPRCTTELDEKDSYSSNENSIRKIETIYTCDCNYKLVTIETFSTPLGIEEKY